MQNVMLQGGGCGGHSQEHSVQSVTYVHRPCSISQVYETYVGQSNLCSAGNSHTGASHLDTWMKSYQTSLSYHVNAIRVKLVLHRQNKRHVKDFQNKMRQLESTITEILKKQDRWSDLPWL